MRRKQRCSGASLPASHSVAHSLRRGISCSAHYSSACTPRACWRFRSSRSRTSCATPRVTRRRRRPTGRSSGTCAPSTRYSRAASPSTSTSSCAQPLTRSPQSRPSSRWRRPQRRRAQRPARPRPWGRRSPRSWLPSRVLCWPPSRILLRGSQARPRQPPPRGKRSPRPRLQSRPCPSAPRPPSSPRRRRRPSGPGWVRGWVLTYRSCSA
mmetsp:Transcript_33480/g.78707  ORF Transcript_33480/g.78707 Transcript_33480/m.78707 type:complete len:210 (+) Transcript_33480:368-997(+)